MPYTDKVGYIVRFGGPEGIQWIPTGETQSSPSSNSPPGPINPAMAGNPVEAVIAHTLPTAA